MTPKKSKAKKLDQRKQADGNVKQEFSWDWKFVCAACAVFIVLAMAAYFPALDGDFIWDDDDYVSENPLLYEPDGLKRIWFSTDVPSQYFPLVYTTFRFEYALWGLNPIGYHVVNVLLHAINALLIWFFLSRLGVRGSWFAALIFLLHPVHVESVAWITERKNVLSMLFFMLTLIVSLKFIGKSGTNQWKYYALGFFLYALALFSKTTACTIPAALLLIVYLRGQKIGKREILQVTPFMLWGIFMGLVSIWWEKNKQGTIGEEFAFTMAERLIIATKALWFYLWKLAWPSQLAFSYTKWELNQADPLQYIYLLGFIAVIFGLWHWRKQLGRGPTVALMFFAVNLAPLLGFIDLYTFRYSFVADHYQYVASLGPIALFAFLVSKGWENPRLKTATLYVLPCVVLLSLGVLTWKQSHIYQDNEALWTDTLSKNPGSFMGHNNLGIIYEDRGQIEKAVYHYKNAVELNPDLLESHLNLGIRLGELGRGEEAEYHFQESLRIDEDSAVIYYNYAVFLANIDRTEEAIKMYRQALEIEPEYIEALENLGVIYISNGQFDLAVENFRKVLAISPGRGETRNNLAVAYYYLGMYERAWREVERAFNRGFEPHPAFLELLIKEMPPPIE